MAIEIKFLLGDTLDKAMGTLYLTSERLGQETCGSFNGHMLTSALSVDEAYQLVLGKSKAQFDADFEKFHDDFQKRQADFEQRKPKLREYYIREAKGVIQDNMDSEWIECVDCRLNDIYHGSELKNALDICKIMRDETKDYQARLKEAYKVFNDYGHSGRSAHITADILRHFCPYGADIADAVMNFRFGD